MNQPTDRKETDGFASKPAVDRLVPERPLDVVIADIVAAEPHKHRVSLERYKQLTALRALKAGTDNDQYVFEEHCRAYGLDPDANMGGNRPRYSMGENGVIKDHETGETYGEPPLVATAPAPGLAPGAALDQGGAQEDAQPAAAATDTQHAAEPSQPSVRAAGVGLADHPVACEHSFLEPIEAATPCTLCGITFEAYANS